MPLPYRLVAIGLAVLSLPALTACVNDPAEVAALEARMQLDVELATEVRMYYSDSAVVRLVLTAPTMLNYVGSLAEARQEFPDGLKLVFFDEAQDTSSVLEAQWGVYARRENTITVRDSVVWQSVEGQRLETEELNWSENTGLIESDKFVVLTQPDALITGYGLRANQDFSDARVLEVDGFIRR